MSRFAVELAPHLISLLGSLSLEEFSERFENAGEYVTRAPTVKPTKIGRELETHNISFVLGGNGSVSGNEKYYVTDYNAEKPFTIFAFEYSITIHGRYTIKIHFHPDSTASKHAFVHIQYKAYKEKEKILFLNPFPKFDLNPFLQNDIDAEKKGYWNASIPWPEFFIKMFEEHSTIEGVTVSDCLETIFNKLLGKDTNNLGANNLLGFTKE